MWAITREVGIGLCWITLAVLVLPVRVSGDVPKRRGTTAGETRSDNGLEMELVWCPAGTFTLGSPPSEPGRDADEDPVPVTLTRGFWLGQCEVTQDEWFRLMDTRPWQGQEWIQEGGRFPATCVSWDDAREFASRLTKQEREAGRLPAGWEYSLPTEAQWEYGCRAGTSTPYAFGDSAEKLDDYAWNEHNAWNCDEKYAHAVGQKQPNAWGLHDLHGNIDEWCLDRYRKRHLPGEDPLVDLPHLTDRVIRGGTWCDRASSCRSAYRVCHAPNRRLFHLGFRVVLKDMTPDEPAKPREPSAPKT